MLGLRRRPETHFGVNAGFAAAAVQKRILELTRRWRRRVTKKNVTWNVWEGGGEKYERHSETSSCLCNPSGSYFYINSDVADRSLLSSFPAPSPRAYEYPPRPALPSSPMG